ncbi:hypothetical protein DSM25558_3202 [Agrobacterium sp. DSM 25558]|nr:hypothetical protein DSM25558_3202 [Agrobacterium sp. DSM 25558]
MTREGYEHDLCARNGTASFVSVNQDAGFDGWEPKVGGCHDNVDYWVKHHAGHAAVRGWIAYMSGGPDHVVYTARSVVRGAVTTKGEKATRTSTSEPIPGI